MEPITQSDLLNYKFLSGIRFCPDGSRAAFVVASSNEEENSYERRLWLCENGKLRQLTDLSCRYRSRWGSALARKAARTFHGSGRCATQ